MNNEARSKYYKTANMVIAKLIEQDVKDLSPAELHRAFRDCVAPEACKRYVKLFEITMEDLK